MDTVKMLPLRIETYPDEDGTWISCSPELDVFSQGESFDEAQQNLKEALKLWFAYCIEHGTLEQALAECGFTPVRIESIKETLPGFIRPATEARTECHA